jgi:hypothetical protein
VSVSADERLLTPDEVAERWQIVCKAKKAEAVYRMVRNGQIPRSAYVRLGKHIRFPLARLIAFEEDGGQGLDEGDE